MPRVPAPVIPEESNQRTAVSRAGQLGYITLETNEHRRKVTCECGRSFYPAGGFGRKPGVPDLLITALHWPPAIWFGAEMKGSRTPLSWRQKELHAQRRIFVTRDWDPLGEALQDFETWRAGRPVDQSGESARLSMALLEISERIKEAMALMPQSPARTILRLAKLIADRALRR